eukprot:10132214-Lingulodinium_polyedra.AAC.1
MLSAAHQLVQHCQRLGTSTGELLIEQTYEYESLLMRTIREGIRDHRLPSTLIGFGHASLARKVAGATHSMRLECNSHAALARYSGSFCAMCTDYGVESRLAYVKP